jgi:acetolactate decarboxylase
MTGSSLYLCAPINALVEGIYRERIPLARLREHGDFGLGTFDSLDGEMVMVDGRVYQIAASGVVREITEPAATPFAAVTRWKPASHDDLAGEVDYDGFLDWLLTLLPSPNLVYALRIEGAFADVRVRSVPRQEGYKPLVEVAREQPEFSFVDAEGTLAGFYTPPFLDSLSAPGLHLHYLSDDRTEGGHLLSCRPRGVRASVQFIRSIEVGLPMSLDYLTWDFRRDTSADLEEAEK